MFTLHHPDSTGQNPGKAIVTTNGKPIIAKSKEQALNLIRLLKERNKVFFVVGHNGNFKKFGDDSKSNSVKIKKAEEIKETVKTLKIEEIKKAEQIKIKPLSSNKFNGYNLHEIFNELNSKYFNNRIVARIKWGRTKRGHTWGWYMPSARLININPQLNQEWVPREALASVIHHEMCHQACPMRRGFDGRAEIHHAEFKACESKFPDRKYWRKWLNVKFRDKFQSALGTGSDQLAENFKKFGHLYGFSPDDLGRTFQERRTIFQIIGLNPNRPKYPVMVKTNRGKVYIFPPDRVLSHLGKRSVPINIRTASVGTITCPVCNSECTKKMSRWGNYFWACPNWPRCAGRCPRIGLGDTGRSGRREDYDPEDYYD